MAIAVVPNGDGTFRYRDTTTGSYMTAEEAKAAPSDSILSKLAGTASAAMQSATNAIGNALTPSTPTDLDERMKMANQLAAAYNASASTNPDMAARVQEAANVLKGDPATFAQTDPATQQEAIQAAKDAQNRPSDWAALASKNPITANYLSDPINMAKSRDDLNILTSIESIGKAMSASFDLSNTQQERSDFGMALMKSGKGLDELDQEQKAKLEELDSRIKDLQADAPKSTWSASGVLGALAGMVPQAISGLKNVPIGMAAGVGIGAAAGGVGAVPGGIAGAGIGFQTGFAQAFMNNTMGNTYLDEMLKGVDKNKAAEGSGLGGALTYGLSLPLVTQWMKLPALATSSGLLKSLGLQTVEQSFIGAGLTASQLAGIKTAEGRITDWDANDLSTIAEGGVDMIPIALSMSAPGYGWAALHNLGKAVDESKTLQRDPAAVADNINKAVDGSGIADLTIPGDSLYSYLQNVAEKRPQEAKDVLSTLNVDQDSLNNAVATGGSVSVKLGNYEVLSSEHRDALLADVSVGGRPSAREMQRAYEEEKGATAEEVATENTGGGAPDIVQKEPVHTQDIAADSGLAETEAYKQAVADAAPKAEVLPEGYESEKTGHLEMVRKQIETELDTNKLYQAEKDFGFNLQLFGNARDVKEIARRYSAGELTDSQSTYFDTVAEQHGYSSGDHLAKDIKRNRPRDEELTTRLKYAADMFDKDNGFTKEDQAVRAEINEGALKKAAMESATMDKVSSGSVSAVLREKAISDKVSRFKDAENKLAMDIEMLKVKAKTEGKMAAKYEPKIAALKDQLSTMKKQHADDLKQATKNETYTARWYEAEREKDNRLAKEWMKTEEKAGRLARSSDVTISDAKRYAKNMTDVLPVGEAMDYKWYHALANKAKAASEKYYRKGMYELAGKWKAREVTNRALAMQAMTVFKEYNKHRIFLNQMKATKRETFKTQENFAQAANLLERFGMGRKDFIPTDKQENLSAWALRMNDATGNVAIEDWLYNENIRGDLSGQTLQQVQDIGNAIRNIRAVANREKKSITAAKGEDLETIKKTHIELMQQKEATHVITEEPSKFKAAVRGMSAELQTFQTTIGKLTGWTDNAMSDFWIRSVHEASNLESKRIQEFKSLYKELWKDYSSRERSKMTTKKIYIDELDVSVTKDKLIGVALNLGNEVNRQKLVNTKPIDFTEAKAWDEKVIMQVLQKNLDAKDWKMVQGTWDAINTLWSDIAEHHKSFTGFAPEKVESLPIDVTLKSGEVMHLEGGYFPLVPDRRNNLVRALQMDDNAALSDMRNGSMSESTKRGHTKLRSNAQYAVSLDPSITVKHVMDVVHDMYFRGIVSDFNRILKDQNYASAIFGRSGAEGVKAFGNYLQNICGAAYAGTGMDALSGTIRWMKKTTANAAIGLRLGVVAQNFANVVLYPGAVKGFGVTDTIAGMIRYGALDYFPKVALNWKAAGRFTDEIYSLSSFMKDRSDRPDYSLATLQSDLMGRKSSLAEFSGALMNFTDNLTAKPMWKQAYMKKLAETGSQSDAVYYADSLIKGVIGSGRRYDQAEFMRANSGFSGVMNTFQGFMTTELNRWMKEANIASDSIMNIPRFAAFVGSRVLIFSLLSNLLGAKLPGEKEDPFKWFVAGALSYPFQLLPLVRDVVPTGINAALGLQTYGYRPPVAFGILESAATAALKTGNYMQKNSKVKGQSVVESWAKTGAYLTGVPDQMNAWFFNAYDLYTNQMRNPTPMDVFKRRPMKERK